MKRVYITSDPKIQGGMPVVAGTRVPVDVLLHRLKEGYTINQIHDMYRHISVDTLKKVLDELASKLPSITNHGKTLLQA